jgi:recombination protein RecA
MTHEKKKDKEQALKKILSEVQKEFGKESIQVLGEAVAEPIEAVPTGSIALDRALGISGYPRGRIVEIYGPESSGKTTLTMHAMAEVQKLGGLAAYVDAEHAFDARYARATGVQIENLLLSQPDSGEQALELVDTLTRSGELDLIVIDSVAALVPQAEIDGTMSDNLLGLQARLMSRALRKLASHASKTQTTLMFVNQLRQKIGVTFGSAETTPGGNALKFYSSVRLDVRRIGKVTANDAAIGNRTRVRVVKNKCAPPFSEAEFDIRWGVGIDVDTDLIDCALAAGVLSKNGSHYLYQGKSVGHGRERVREALVADPELARTMQAATLQAPWNAASSAGAETLAA